MTDLDQIVIEERNIEKMEVFFSCIDKNTGSVFWKNKRFLDEKFWTGIEDTKSNLLFLHMFEKPDMPLHKKIIAVNLIDGTIDWINHELTYFACDDNFIYAYKQNFESKEYFKLEKESGQIISSLGNEEDAKPYLNLIPEKNYSRYLFSSPISQLENEVLINLIRNHAINSKYNAFIEYILFKDFLIFNFYDKASEAFLINKLFIINQYSQKILHTETINSATPAPVPDSFFIYDDILYFIKNKKELIAYKL